MCCLRCARGRLRCFIPVIPAFARPCSLYGTSEMISIVLVCEMCAKKWDADDVRADTNSWEQHSAEPGFVDVCGCLAVMGYI
jgi:hypothetical protein